MKIFENTIIIWIALVSFLTLLIGSFLVLPKLGVNFPDVIFIAVSALLSLPVAYLAIAVPINHTLKLKKKEEQEEIKESAFAAAQFVASELDANLIILEQLQIDLEKDYSKEAELKHLTEKKKLQVHMGQVGAVANELASVLDDSSYKSIISSGMLIKLKNEKLTGKFVQAYSDIKRLKLRSRNISSFFSMLLNPPTTIIRQGLADKMIEEKVPTAVERLKEDLSHTITSIREVFPELNKVLKTYDKEFKIGGSSGSDS